MSNPAQAERQALCDQLDGVGPDAPTLCEGWSARDLAAHLVVRERRPDAAVGILARPLARYTASVQRKVAARPWPDLVAAVRSGPPWFWRPLDRFVNTVEYFVHDEDARRAQPEWSPRPLAADLDDALWRALRRTGRLLARRSPVPVVARTADGREMVMKKGDAPVTVAGPPGELVLFFYGRQDHARVEAIGPPRAVEALRSARLGL